jgi:hypothetical protein
MPDSTLTPGSSLALIGNAAEQTCGGRADVSILGVFDRRPGGSRWRLRRTTGYAAGTHYGIVAPTG